MSKPTYYCDSGHTRIGRVFIVAGKKGICALRLGMTRQIQAELRRWFAGAQLITDPEKPLPVFQQLDEVLAGQRSRLDVPLDLHGTPFQRRVWQALQRIPRGQTCSYSELARRIGKPRAVRAVASACARNPVAILVPCHRVLRQDGGLGGYRWGTSVKRKLLEGEQKSNQR